MMLEIINLSKIYGKNETEFKALDNINLSFKNNGLISIVGESGSGKTTLLNCVSGLDKPTLGEIKGLKKDEVSFVFQDYQLIDNMSVKDNLNLFNTKDNDYLMETLAKVKMDKFYDRKIYNLSAGQKQRIAIARALLLDTKYIFADEPTGNLDSETSKGIVELLKEIAKEKLIIVVTHNKELFKEYSDRMITLKDGVVISDESFNEIIETERKEYNKNSDIKFTLKNAFKLRKAATSKNVSSKIFNVILTITLLLVVFLGLNIFTNNTSKTLLNAFKKYELPLIEFKFENSGLYYYEEAKYVTDDMIEELNKKKIPYALGYGCVICDEVKSNIIYGKNTLSDGEIILSHQQAIKTAVDNDIDVLINGKLDLSVLINQEIDEYGKIYKIVGIEQKIEKVVDKTIDSKYEGYMYTTYMNQNTYDYASAREIGEENYIEIFKAESVEHYEIAKRTFSYELLSGRLPQNENEVVLGEYYCNTHDIDLSNSESCKILIGNREKGTIIESREFTVVGMSNVASPVFYSDEVYCDVVSLYNKGEKEFYRTIVLFTNECTADQITYLKNKGMVDDSIFHDSLSLTEGVMKVAAWVLIIVIIPLSGLLLFMQMINAKQLISSQRRTIGILKSVSFNNKKISKVLVADSLIDNGIAFIISFILSPILVLIVNSVLIDKEFCFMNWLNYEPLLVILLFVTIIIVSLLSQPVALSRLNKKTDIELVYEK